MSTELLCLTLKIFNQLLKINKLKSIRNGFNDLQLSAWKRVSKNWENIKIIQRMEEGIQITLLLCLGAI